MSDNEIELTEWINGVARKHGMGGSESPARTDDPETRANIEAEADAFSRFPTDFDSYQTQETSLTPEERRELDARMAAMIERAEQLRERLFAGRKTEDLTPDELDQLLEVFAHIPRGLVPPRYKKELQDWRYTRDAMLEMRLEEMMEEAEPEVAEAVSGMIETLNAPAENLTEVLELVPSETVEHLNDVIKKVSGALSVIQGTIETASACGEHEQSKRTALELRMEQNQKLKALDELSDAALDLGSNFVPVLGTINNGKNVLLKGSETLLRIQNAISDRRLQNEASVRVASQLAGALGQSSSRETRLGAQAGVDATTAALDVAGDLSMAADGGTLKIVNGTLKIGSKVVFHVADAMSDTRAWNTLQAARAGSEEAQQEVFRRHAHYAKYLLARYASEGDAIATRFFLQRGLTERDIAQNSIKILMEFGLQQSEEEEAPESTSNKLKAKLEKVSAVASKVGRSVRSAIQKARSKLFGASANDATAEKDPVVMGKLFTVEALQKMTKTLQEARQEKARVGDRAPAWLDQNIRNLEAGLTEAHVPLRSYMTELVGALSDAALEDSQDESGRAAAIKAQLTPVREALGYLADVGFLI